MRSLGGIVLAAFLLAPVVSLAAPVPINLSTWQKRGPAGNGVWTVAPDGNSVFQSINGDPTFFVSPTNQINTTIRGSIKVETAGDDDLIGFVFGYTAPVANGNDMDYVLFDWKRANQPSGGFTSFAGFALSRVDGTITNYAPGFWGRTDSPGFDNLANLYGPTLGWVDNVQYDFSIVYQEGHIRIDLSGGAFGTGQTIFDVSGSFPDGAVGFYNYSQASVRYSGLTQEATPPIAAIPEPGTSALMLCGIALLGAGMRRRRSLQDRT